MIREIFRIISKLFRDPLVSYIEAGSRKIFPDVTDEEVEESLRLLPPHFALTNVQSGCTKVTKVLNAVNQEATIYCAGQAKVGFNVLSVTGTVTLTFYGSTDGITFNPISVGTFPSATPPATNVASTAAAGTWERNVENYTFFRLQMTSGSGPASVILTASVDSSYQEAFTPPTNVGVSLATVYPSTTSSSGVNTMTIPAQANKTINLTFLEVAMAGPGGGAGAQLRIWDSAVDNRVPLYSCYLTPAAGSVGTTQLINLPTDAQGNKGIQGSPGNALVIQIINLGNITAIINARASML